MEIIDDFGLPVALVTPDDLPAEPWRGLEQAVAVVRMTDPPPALRPELTRRGFVCKPATLTWLAPLGEDEGAFLRTLPHKSRQYVRRARRHNVILGLREVVEDRISPANFDAFLTLYEDQVARMRYGVAFARRNRDTVLHGPQKYFGVFLFDQEELVGGCVALESPDERAIRIRFSAVTDRERAAGVPRALYCTAMRVARDKGFAWATLGDDPNLYGHIARPGLFTFKARMGFRAVPSQEFGDPHPWDEADLVLSLDRLSDPTLMLEYGTPADGPSGSSLRSCLIARAPVDVRDFSAEFLTGTVVRPPGQPG
ncbi:GNAT family N-acetyltransferase [Streptomyces sp. UNOC14_S4]|uniref:GNAT family N-acetyltransferase n=1 Tax=Streptomyces sp. UNOC14_S4 TaxID=2872340 RepID=UPI001E4019DB|nr:GNAT family N-acetyltransferase [Streptomyces sp. UNOC14_S4]MCC3768942.1 GNAT family N-acetyltransferase [Streptomyces sp. UNOC14_S4]